MADDIEEHFHRVDWAKGEISALRVEVETYLNSGPTSVKFHYDLGTGSRVYKIVENVPPPKGIQIRTGTIINELRSILDALACTLAKRNGAFSVDDVYFPTAKSALGFNDKAIQRKIRKLSAADQALISGLKPYPGGNDLLYTLHSADIIRKHQRLVLSANQPRSLQIGSESGWTLDGGRVFSIEYKTGPIGKGLVIAELAADYHIDFVASSEIVFSEPFHIEGKELIATMNNFADLVHSILEIFR